MLIHSENGALLAEMSHNARLIRSVSTSPQKPKRLVMTTTPEIIGYLAATLTTSSFLPQAFMTIKTKDTSSLSLGMYSLFTLGVLMWLIYGLYKSDHAIIFANAITLLLAATILCFKIWNILHKKD